MLSALARGFGEGGYAEAVRSAAAQLAARATQTYVPPTQVARLYAYADDSGLALHWLGKAHTERDFPLIYFRVDPTWEKLRSDSRLRELVARMAFPA
jgi:hypothetical protein